MEKLSTRRLLRYKDSLMKCHEAPNWDDYEPFNRIFKSSTVWKETHATLVDVLNSREHIEGL